MRTVVWSVCELLTPRKVQRRVPVDLVIKFFPRVGGESGEPVGMLPAAGFEHVVFEVYYSWCIFPDFQCCPRTIV